MDLINFHIGSKLYFRDNSLDEDFISIIDGVQFAIYPNPDTSSTATMLQMNIRRRL
jgi:hypothetical protein